MKHQDSSKHRHPSTFFTYHQHAVVHLNTSIYHPTRKLISKLSIYLNTVNLNVMNILSPEFRIWQYVEDHWNGTQLHHLVNIPSAPMDQLYKHMVSSNRHITPFTSTNVSLDDTASLWTLFSHTGIYRIADTCRIRNILLSIFLVPTCQISMLTLMIRFYVTYCCG